MDKTQKTIFLVDDDFDYLVQQKIMLESKGFNIITAEGEKQAKEILNNSLFDLAIVDLMMENMDTGFIICHEIKKKHPAIPIIMATAVASQTGFEFDSITNAEKKWIKADSVITKPIRSEQLLKEIQKLLKNEL